MDDAELRYLLVDRRSVAVRGMSRNPAKVAHRVPVSLMCKAGVWQWRSRGCFLRDWV